MRLRKRTILLGFVGLLLLWGGIAQYYARVVHVVRWNITLPHLPKVFDGVRLLWVTDLHIDSAAEADRMANLLHELDALSPDILLLGGDYTSPSLKMSQYPADHAKARQAQNDLHAYRRAFFAALSDLCIPYGSFALVGEWDDDLDDLAASCLAGNVQLLADNVARVTVGTDSLYIMGLQQTKGSWRTERLSAYRETDTVIVATHHPDAYGTVASRSSANGRSVVDLMLSGHTMGGQVRLGSWTWPTDTVYDERYSKNFYDQLGVPMLISNGVGTKYIGFRWHAPAQALLITLHCAPDP